VREYVNDRHELYIIINGENGGGDGNPEQDSGAESRLLNATTLRPTELVDINKHFERRGESLNDRDQLQLLELDGRTSATDQKSTTSTEVELIIIV